MHFSFLLYIFCIIVFLFSLYLLSNDDYVLIRKNLSTEKVFDLAFLILIVGLFFARVFFVIFNFKIFYLNPLYFFLFPYFPGMSIPGGVLGAILFILLFFKSWKLPFTKLLDFFALSFLWSLPFGLIISLILSLSLKKKIIPFAIIEPIIYLIGALIITKMFQKLSIKEGSLTFIVLILFSVISFLENISIHAQKLFFIFTKDDVILIGFFLLSVILLIRKEKSQSKIRNSDISASFTRHKFTK